MNTNKPSNLFPTLDPSAESLNDGQTPINAKSEETFEPPTTNFLEQRESALPINPNANDHPGNPAQRPGPTPTLPGPIGPVGPIPQNFHPPLTTLPADDIPTIPLKTTDFEVPSEVSNKKPSIDKNSIKTIEVLN